MDENLAIKIYNGIDQIKIHQTKPQDVVINLPLKLKYKQTNT